MALKTNENNKLRPMNTRKEQEKTEGNFSKKERSKDFRKLFGFLSILLSVLFIFKIYASLTQINHVLSKVEEIRKLFNNKESKKREIKYNISAFLENLKQNQIKINFNSLLSIIGIIYLSIHKRNQIKKWNQRTLSIAFCSSIAILLFFDMRSLQNMNIVFIFISLLFSLIIREIFINRIRILTGLLICVLSFYTSYLFLIVFLGATMQKWAITIGLKTFSELFKTDSEIFDPIEKMCKKYNFDIENIYVIERAPKENGTESFIAILHQDPFNSIITIESTIKLSNNNLRQLLISFIATHVVRAVEKLVLYSSVVKFIIAFAHFLLFSIFVAFFDGIIPFHEISAVFFSLQYIFKEYLIEIVFNIIYKKIYSSVLTKMVESSEESIYILDDMLRIISIDPHLYCLTQMFEIFSPFPSLGIACSKALKTLKSSN